MGDDRLKQGKNKGRGQIHMVCLTKEVMWPGWSKQGESGRRRCLRKIVVPGLPTAS